jgi:hypothetical protein
MARIVTVCSTRRPAGRLVDMSHIRWFRISTALAKLGHTVDVATMDHRWRLHKPVVPLGPNLRNVPLSRIRWGDYDVVKTLFHEGFSILQRYGGADHPFIISKLGSVVGDEDLPGIYFYGGQRRRLFRVQRLIHRKSRYVTVLSEPAAELWRECFGRDQRLLLVPGAADAEIPAATRDPYPQDGLARCVFVGNFYTTRRTSQPEAHRTLTSKLNRLGELLRSRGVRLYVLGPGQASSLDPRWVTYCGVAEHGESWDYVHFANVGLVVAAGSFMHNNESTKIYHYLRAGLPVVSEAGFPNDHVVREAGLGFVTENGDLPRLADRVAEAAVRPWNREHAIRYILDNHIWEKRAESYDRLLRSSFPSMS